MKYSIHFSFIIYLLVTMACLHRNEKISTDIVATIQEEKILSQDIDLAVKQELYNKLYQIFIIRNTQLQRTINLKIILLESEKYHVSPDSLLNYFVYSRIETQKLLNFPKVSYNEFNNTQIQSNHQVNYKTSRSNRQEILFENLWNDKLKKYLDSLQVLYKVSVYLQPPQLPMDIVDKISKNYKGNLNSNVTVWLISDLDCNTCREAKPTYDSLFTKYKNKIKYAFSDYSTEVKISSLALECSSNQNKFWDMYNSLSNSTINISFDRAIQLAYDIGLNVKKFISEMQDSLTYHKIYANFKRINDAGIVGTPSIIVNNKVINNPTSMKEIENVINYELSIHR
jgi:protein-disulfide isomerase